MVCDAYMGRMFAAPLAQSGDGSVVYLNFGWPSKGDQRWPEYRAELLGDVVSAADFDDLRAACLSHLAAHGVDGAAEACAQRLCRWLPCCFCPLAVAREAAGQATRELDTLAAQRQGAWAVHGLQVELVRAAAATSRDGDALSCAYDQDGLLLTSADGARPVWPPPGLSLVVYTPTRELRSRWPQAPRGAPAPPRVPAERLDAGLAAHLAAHGLLGADAAAAARATSARTVPDLARLADGDVAALPDDALPPHARDKLAHAVAAARM